MGIIVGCLTLINLTIKNVLKSLFLSLLLKSFKLKKKTRIRERVRFCYLLTRNYSLEISLFTVQEEERESIAQRFIVLWLTISRK